ncbi:MAG: kinase [Desulfobacterales bacterium]|nr:kinase [Desulfobacterales bacterium]
MIINRTPYRLSFLGGGTDYPSWYLKHGGSTISTSINKYCYITCRALPPFFEHRIRVVYSKIELCNSYEEIDHPAVRETLRFLNLDCGLEIHYDGDLPARSGMGSSSSFNVGLLHALYAFKGEMVSKRQLTRDCIHVEQDMIKEIVGSQDQACAAHGGLNHIEFLKNGEIKVNPLTLSKQRLDELDSHLMLFYTGINRKGTASDVAKSYVDDIESKTELLTELGGLVDIGLEILGNKSDICEFGKLLHESWMLKRDLSNSVSNIDIDDLYKRALDNGALGGKITGAGGGGFLLLFVPPSEQQRVRKVLSKQIYVPFSFESRGSQILFYQANNENYSILEKDRDKRVYKLFKEQACG